MPYIPYLYVGTYSPQVVRFTGIPPIDGKQEGWFMRLDLCEAVYGVYNNKAPTKKPKGWYPLSIDSAI